MLLEWIPNKKETHLYISGVEIYTVCLIDLSVIQYSLKMVIDSLNESVTVQFHSVFIQFYGY